MIWCEPVNRPRPGRSCPACRADLETIALSCLQQDPRRRYASASALADDLERRLDRVPDPARPVSRLEHAARWCRRRPAFASLLAVLAFTVALSIIGLLTLWRHSEADAGGPRLPWPVPSRATRRRPARSAISSACCRRPSMPRKCSRRNDSQRRRTRSAISRQSCVGIQHSPRPTSSRSVKSNASWRKISGARGIHPESRALLMDSLDLLDMRRLGADDPDGEVARRGR